MTRGRLAGAGGVVVAVIVVVAIVWHWHETRTAWTAAMPAPPDLAAFPAELRTRVAALTARAAQRDVAALAELGPLYHANGFPHEAAAVYGGLQRFDAANPRWPHLLAHLLAGHGQLAAAAALWQRAAGLAPDYPPARVRWGEALLKTNEADRAAAVYAAAVAAAPQDAHARLGLARCEMQRERLTAAREQLQRAVAAQPDFGAAWHLLATVYDRLGNADGAERARARAASLKRFREMSDPWFDALSRDCYDIYRLRVVAAAARAAGAANEALPLLERAQSLAPEDAAVQRDLGETWMDLRDFSRAQAAFARAAALEPGYEPGYLRWLAACTPAGDTEAAGRVLLAGLEQFPDSPALHVAHGQWLAAAGRFDAALVAFARVTQLKPTAPEAYHEIATIHFRFGRDAEGVAVLEALLVHEPEHVDTLRALARRAIELGDAATATRWLERLRSRPEGATLLVDLGDEFRRRFGRAP